jgi:hypothetical protein
MNSGSVVLSNINIGSFDTTFSFSNGNGINIGGTDNWSSCLTFAPGGSSCNPDLVMGLNENSGNVNGTSMFLFGVVTIAGSNFALPTSGTAFSITAPVLFSGSFESCVGGFGPFGGCNPGAPFVSQFNVNGPGSVVLTFTGTPLELGGVIWQVSSATYTLNTVPEPASIVLLGTGALAVFGKLRQRKS